MKTPLQQPYNNYQIQHAYSIKNPPIHCKNSGVKFNTPGVVRGPHQVGVDFNTSRCLFNTTYC